MTCAIDKLQITHRGVLTIASSGYADRYVQSDSSMIIRANGIEFSVWDRNEYTAAILTLAGINNPTADDISAAVEKWNSAPRYMSSKYERDDTYVSYKTTSKRLRAAINIMTGYPNLSQYGIDCANNIRSEITADDWASAKYSLDKINADHELRGKQVVEVAAFTN